MPPILEEESVTADEVRLSDGRRARVHRYNPERTRFVAAFMTRTGFPSMCSPAVVLVHGALLALAAVETIDGKPLAWPEPSMAGIDRLMLRSFWKLAAEGWAS